MYQKILVEELKADGRLLVEALKRNRFPVTAAAWYDFPEAQWRLVVVSPAVDLMGPMAAYSRVQRALQSVEPSELTQSGVPESSVACFRTGPTWVRPHGRCRP